MTIYDNTRSSTYTNTFARFYVDDFERTQTLYLDGLSFLQTLKDNRKHLGSETVGLSWL